MVEKLNILVLSSRMPSYSANWCGDIITSLTRAGHNVEFGFEGIENVIRNITTKHTQTTTEKCITLFVKLLKKILWRIYPIPSSGKYWMHNGQIIFHPFEDKPPFPTEKVLTGLKGSYDLCIFVFCQDLFTTKTFSDVYRKYHCPILIYSPDMTPITGGCYYFGKCRNFEKECGKCPILGSKSLNDQTHKNFLYKKNVYNTIECALLGNNWMLDFAMRSKMFENSKMHHIALVLNEDIFKPRNSEECRKSFNILNKKKYIFLARYRNILRKGMDVLIDGINDFYEKSSFEVREKSLLLLIGEKMKDSSVIKMDVQELGYLNQDQLISAYCASTVFLCSSTEDAGPSMINQSMACGTPVIAFDTGTAMDFVENGITGYKVDLTEKNLWNDGIFRIVKMSDQELLKMRKNAREKAVQLSGMTAFSNIIEEIYQDFRPYGKK